VRRTDLLRSTTSVVSPLDTCGDGDNKISEFPTLQSLTSFTAITGAFSAAFDSLRKFAGDGPLSANWVPYALAGVWGLFSILISLEGLAAQDGGKLRASALFGDISIAILNSLVLGSAVVGVGAVTSG
jgi:hypothetical protein